MKVCFTMDQTLGVRPVRSPLHFSKNKVIR